MQRYDAYVGVLPQSSLARILSESYTTPLGQLVLGTAVKQRSPETHVVVFDPVRTPPEQMWQKIQELHALYDRVLVGLSLLSGNTSHGFHLAQQCAETGIDVIVGGPEVAGYHSAHLMRARPYITYGVDYLAERVLPEIIIGTPLDKIPGLTFRDHGTIRGNPPSPLVTRLDWLHVAVDYGLLDNITGNTGTTYLMGNDCFIADKRCYFCGRLGMGNPETKDEIDTRVARVWHEIKDAFDLGLTHYFNSADSALRNPRLFTAFADAMPDWFNPQFHHLFANAHELTPEVMPLLKKLRATVYLGVENAALENHRKGKIHFTHSESRETDMMSSKRAIDLLDQYGIPMRLSFVFGGPNESPETLSKNLEIITALVQKYPTITDLELNPIEVLPGTEAFRDLMKEKREKYTAKEVPYDTLEMSTDLVPLISQVARKEVLDWIARMYEAIRHLRPTIRVNTKGISPEEYTILVESSQE
ncbi:hypothetical protein HYW21_00655 [Candidatus Woesearchaeota archaeon]|nr:hypothetical protein [Candidatus Woesearchaeota archaeon]